VSPLLVALNAAALASAIACIHSEAKGPRGLFYVLKPLTTVLILAVALAASHGLAGRYQLAILLGLIFSLAGDILLMLPSDRFVAGLASFLLAHLCYIRAFTAGRGVDSAPLVLLLYLVFAALVLRALWGHLGPMRVPVALYVAVIVTMAWQAGARATEATSPSAIAGAAGAAIFLASDALLAIARFRGSFPHAQGWILGTYFAAQWLIATSVSAAAPFTPPGYHG